MIFLRLHEALAEDFPTVQKLVGQDRFEQLARDYFTLHPSQSFTLSRVGLALPDYLATECVEPDSAALADVARLERALVEVTHAKDTPLLTAEHLAAQAAEDLHHIGFVMTEALRLLAFDHNVLPVVDALYGDEPMPSLEARRSWTVLWRQGQTVWRRSVSEAPYEALRSLCDGGTIADAVDASLAAWIGDPAGLEQELSAWFAEWLRDGLFSELSA
jgi:hypothetical protein